MVSALSNWIGVDARAGRGGEWPWRAHGWAIVSVLVCTIVDKALFGRLAEANLVMVYLFGTLLVALRGDRGAAFTAAMLSVVGFDLFFVPPYLSFAVSDTQYLFTFLVMGSVGVVISDLTARLASEITATRQRERRARALYELSRSLLAAKAPDEVLAEGARVIGLELGQPVEAWLKGPEGDPLPVALPGVPFNANEQAVLRGVLQTGTPAGPGTGSLPGASHLVLPVRTERQIHGALAVRCPEGDPPPSPEARATLETGANQLAIALDQARAREEADAALRQAEVERTRSAILSSVSHDLRTPLTGIVGAASTLVEGIGVLMPEVLRELAQGIVVESEHLSRLVTNLLQATRLEAGTVRLARSWFSLEDLLDPARARLAQAPGEHPLCLELAADLPSILADAALVEQVLTNLLENAARHTPPGTAVTVRAWQDGAKLWVEVADRGPGLPPGEEERIFEKFHRYARQGDAEGAGLGLAICRGIVMAHGGVITAHNLPAGGASFRFSMPLTPPPGVG